MQRHEALCCQEQRASCNHAATTTKGFRGRIKMGVAHCASAALPRTQNPKISPAHQLAGPQACPLGAPPSQPPDCARLQQRTRTSSV